MRFLTPTENKRLNELVGFLCMAAALMILAALFSYNPHDAAFNVSASSGSTHSAANWMGPAGAYGSDLLFQVFGFAAFLVPMALLVLGWRWFRSRAIGSPVAALVGYALMLLSLPSLLALLPFWDIRGAVPAGGMLGSLLAGGLRSGFNWGAYVIAFAVLITAIFLTTSFSFASTTAWATSSKGPKEIASLRCAGGVVMTSFFSSALNWLRF